MYNEDNVRELTTIKITKTLQNRFTNLRGEKSVDEFFSELMDFYEKRDTLIEKDKKEKKLTPYGPVIKHLRETLDRNYSSYAYALRISPDELPKVESGEMELTTEQLRGLANRLNIYVEALEKGLVIPLPRELRW